MIPSNSIIVLTGAGISAESGIKTFRDHNGLWENHAIEDVATLEGFRRNPKLVYAFYTARRLQLLDRDIQPNAGHFALAKLEESYAEDFLLITQNVDNLHERAGSKKLLHMHGELLKTICIHCDFNSRTIIELEYGMICPGCGKPNSLRPDVVWFGEVPYHMDEIEEALQDCSIFIAIGTSGEVYPAAAFVRWVKHANPKAKTIEINLNSTTISADFDEIIRGSAAEKLPEWVCSLKN